MNITEVSELVCKSKDNYQNQLFKKLTNPLQTSSKTYKYILQWKRSCFSFFFYQNEYHISTNKITMMIKQKINITKHSHINNTRNYTNTEPQLSSEKIKATVKRIKI